MPYGTGLGSSSAMTVGLVKAISKIKDLDFDDNQIANEAYKIEKKLRFTIQKTDHYMSSFGGVNLFTYKRDETTIIQKSKDINFDIDNIEKICFLLGLGA